LRKHGPRALRIGTPTTTNSSPIDKIGTPEQIGEEIGRLLTLRAIQP
jgi:hypothetical protein